jgi:hypothetical protein
MKVDEVLRGKVADFLATRTAEAYADEGRRQVEASFYELFRNGCNGYVSLSDEELLQELMEAAGIETDEDATMEELEKDQPELFDWIRDMEAQIAIHDGVTE